MRYKKSVFRTFALITQVGISMLTPIFLCVFLGSFLRNHYELPVFLPLLMLGILAGLRNAYVLLMQCVKEAEQDKRRDSDEFYN